MRVCYVHVCAYVHGHTLALTCDVSGELLLHEGRVPHLVQQLSGGWRTGVRVCVEVCKRVCACVSIKVTCRTRGDRIIERI